jgi:hypothetical protein
MNLLTELNHEEAEALAQLFKRIGFTDFRALAVNDAEAYTMRAGANKVARALAELGYEPR